MPSTSFAVTAAMSVSSLLRRSALCVLALAAIGSWWVRARGFAGIQDYYFIHQDLPLLFAGGIAMYLGARTPLATVGVPVMVKRRAVIALILAAGIIAYAGTWLVMNRYAMSRDEDLADFAARYMQNGLIGLPIPTSLQYIGNAMSPLGADGFINQGYWISGYLPMNSALRAAAGLIGDRWLAGPLLLILGIGATWCSARRLWPAEREAAFVAVFLAVTSTQLVVNAMTPFATTAHFALNAVWIACFLRGGRSGHAAAVFCGLVATGLHQFHFHMLFLSGFITWMALTDRKHLAMLYIASALGYYLFWDMVWPRFVMMPMLGVVHTTELTVSQTFLNSAMIRLSRFTILEPLTSAARFMAWQNVLMLPLIWLGAITIRRKNDSTLPITFAFAVSVGIGLAIMPWQGFGYGYRYLHHVIPCMLLLAASGAMHLYASNSLPKHHLLIASGIFAGLVTAPFAMWRSHELLAPYAAAYGLARSAPADVVVVDTLAGAYIQDIVRIDDPTARPLLLDLSELSSVQIDRLCATQRVMIFGEEAVRAVGVQSAGEINTPLTASIIAKRANMVKRGCATPVPVKAG